MFNNQLFDSWLDKKSDEILSKVDREKITTEEMIILVLKAQTNHFHHADIDLKNGLSGVKKQIIEVEHSIEKLDQRVERLEQRVDRQFELFEQRFEKIDQRFEKIDQRFIQMDQKIDNRFMWMIGITVAMSGGIYLKLFLG